MGWSAPLNHPTEWTSHGIIYEPSQNPEYMAGDNEEMYAPDVMQGVDGRYYLYYCFGGSAGHSRIGVAVFIVKYKCRKLQTKNVGRCNCIL